MILKKFITLARNFICIFGLFIISPFLFLAVLMVIIEDGLPIFFIQERIGKNEAIFSIIKLRTLKRNTPNTATHQLDQKHKLLCGNIIRKIKLDEFPQLINVLKGDINLIGPRPGLPSQFELTNERLLKEIYAIKPGITGLAQVLGYDMSNPLKLAKVDKIYIENKSMQLDLMLLLGTFFKYPRHYLRKLIT